jgi:hypothetical protein
MGSQSLKQAIWKHMRKRKQSLLKNLAKYPNIKPVSCEAFGGRMSILGKKIFDTVDLVKAEAWAEELGKKFT